MTSFGSRGDTEFGSADEDVEVMGRWNSFIWPLSSVVRYSDLESWDQRIELGERSQFSVG